ncbi:DUF5703 family protein [Gordonia sp. CPCC 206044]|uniref:DUF5703 family protein n=1 Tax=Gordonia sp. CPCC 206044 TaxID=3140793 RepID=UPI003AF3F9AC
MSASPGYGEASPRRARSSSRHGSRHPVGWEVSSETHECLLLNLPPDVTRVTASMRLSIEAEFGGWELRRVRLYTDGTRKVLLRRKKPPRARTFEHREHLLDDTGYPENGATAC